MNDAPFAGRRVLVTGGSMGIGREVARVLAEQGARLSIAARGKTGLDEALAELPGDGHAGIELDVGDPAGWEAALSGIDELHGLVTAAAVIEPIGPIGSYEPADFLRALEVNLFGTWLGLHFCLPKLRASRGSAVTFSGGGATSPLPRFDAYAASKAAVVRLTENVAREVARDGVAVNCVAPGFVVTRMQEATLAAGPEGAGPDYHERTQRMVAEGGVPASQAAELVAFLLSPEADRIAGKLVSAQWDPWQDEDFRTRLSSDADFATLRRIDGVFFARIPAEDEQ